MAASPTKLYSDLLRRDFNAFVQRSFLELNPQTKYLDNWHLEVLARKLEEVRHGACRRLIINIPPRHLKSHMASIVFPAWLLGQNPTEKVLTVSYAQDLADKLARDCRALMQSPFYQALFDTRLSQERQAVSDFETTKGGYRLSSSVAGGVTGRGANVIIVDDPMKPDEAQSDLRRGTVKSWYDNTLRSRLNSQETGAIIIVMQRVHGDDLVAHVQQTEKWDVLSFPAIAERDAEYEVQTPYGRRRVRRRTGEALQPALLSLSTLENLRRSMTEYNFSAQYQQDPQPPSGLIVKREYLKFYAEGQKPAKFDQILQSWDTANKVTELSDYSACTTWGVNGRKLYLLNVFQEKLEFPELKRTVRELASLWDADVVIVEDKASGTQLIQELRAESFMNIQAAPTTDSDKIMRLRAQTAKIDGGFVLFPKQAPWLDSYLVELTTFPNAKNDDRVDSTVYALAWLGDLYNQPGAGLLEFYRRQAAESRGAEGADADPVKVRALKAGTFYTRTGESFNHALGQIMVVERELAASMCGSMAFEWVND